MKTVKTVWKVWKYDVWGNARDGFDVNDRRGCGSVEIRCKVSRHNTGTSREFESATPSTRQIRKALGLTGCRFGIDTEGDDLRIDVWRADNGKPLGEIECVSHACLSPLRPRP